MKIFITSDIEGTNSVCDWPETEPDKRFYPTFADRMTGEVVSVCNGINDAGKDAKILIKDAHHEANNLDPEKFPLNVNINRGWSGHPHKMMFGIDKTFDASMMTGYHSGGWRGGHSLAHTMSMKTPKLMINGVIGSEFLMNYYTSLSLGVPVIMVSGNEELCKHVNETDPTIATCVTSHGYGGSTTSEHPEVSRQKLRECAAKSLELVGKTNMEMPKKFETEVTFRINKDAYKASFYPGVTMIDAHTIGFSTNDYFEFLRMFTYVF